MVRPGVRPFLSPRKAAPRCLCSAEFPVQPKRCACCFKAPNPKTQAPKNNPSPSTKRLVVKGATLRAAVLFGPGGVARSLQIHGRDMRVARSLSGPKTPRRKRHRIYALDHLAAPKGVQLPPARSSGIGSFELVWSLELGAWSFFSITHFP